MYAQSSSAGERAKDAIKLLKWNYFQKANINGHMGMGENKFCRGK